MEGRRTPRGSSQLVIHIEKKSRSSNFEDESMAESLQTASSLLEQVCLLQDLCRTLTSRKKERPCSFSCKWSTFFSKDCFDFIAHAEARGSKAKEGRKALKSERIILDNPHENSLSHLGPRRVKFSLPQAHKVLASCTLSLQPRHVRTALERSLPGLALLRGKIPQLHKFVTAPSWRRKHVEPSGST